MNKDEDKIYLIKNLLKIYVQESKDNMIYENKFFNLIILYFKYFEEEMDSFVIFGEKDLVFGGQG